MTEPTSIDHAQKLDREDPLKDFRSRFHFPQHDGKDIVYFCGNSLGLMPKDARDIINEELDAWRDLAVDGHFEGKRPWYSYHEEFSEMAGAVVGAKSSEVVMMQSLTTNLHLLMVSFYRPTKSRYKIVIEGGAFPSDQYAVASQAEFHGFDPKDAIIELSPRSGENVLRTPDVEKALQEHGDEIALVMLSGVNYRTGQVFDMERITKAAHNAGAVCGWDLAHAAGNVELKLHDWNVDFAAFCSYKYINSGPGSVAGAFVHEKHGNNPELPRFAGWWGNDPKTRFEMSDKFVPQVGAGGWQISNAPVFAMAPCFASLKIFSEATMPRLRTKSLKMSDYLLGLIDALGTDSFEIISPRDEASRGCQVSIRCRSDAKALQTELQKHGIVTDYRAPDVIRIAPVPLYNSFEDIWRFADVLRQSVNA